MLISIQFHSIHSFLQMGGYAEYVWPAFSIVILIGALNILIPVLQRKQFMRELQRRRQAKE